MSVRATRTTRTPSAPLRIVIADDHRLIREVLGRVLRQQANRYNVVAEVAGGRTAIAACRQHAPDLLILGLNLPDISGLEPMRAIRRVSPKVRILLFAALATHERVIDLAHSVADGLVDRISSWNDFADAIDRLGRGERHFISVSSSGTAELETSTAAVSKPDKSIALSPREREVLTLIAQGSTTKEVAAKLGVSFKTVDTHRTNLMRKLKTRNVAGLVAYAIRAGLIEVAR